jgi:hypothetical protein
VSFEAMLDYLRSVISTREILNNIFAWAAIGVLTGSVVYVGRLLRQFIATSRKASRRNALSQIRKRVRSDEYYADRQKVEIHALVIAMSAMVMLLTLLNLYYSGSPEALLVSVMVLLLLGVGGLLFHFETTFNAAALTVRMRREKRRRNKKPRVSAGP